MHYFISALFCLLFLQIFPTNAVAQLAKAPTAHAPVAHAPSYTVRPMYQLSNASYNPNRLPAAFTPKGNILHLRTTKAMQINLMANTGVAGTVGTNAKLQTGTSPLSSGSPVVIRRVGGVKNDEEQSESGVTKRRQNERDSDDDDEGPANKDESVGDNDEPTESPVGSLHVLAFFAVVYVIYHYCKAKHHTSSDQA